MTRIAMMLVMALAASQVQARPPENADPALAPWFESLQAEDGGRCCSMADCRPVEYRIDGEDYEALIGNQFEVEPPRWTVVPAARILKKTENPVGRAIACWTPYTGILCFVLPSQV